MGEGRGPCRLMLRQDHPGRPRQFGLSSRASDKANTGGGKPFGETLAWQDVFAARFYAGFLGRTILDAIEHPSPDFRK